MLLSATHPAWWHAASMPPSHCTLWSLALGDIHLGVFLTQPHMLAQSLQGSPCAAPLLAWCQASLESTVRGSAAWQQVGSWVDRSLVPVEIQQWLQPAGWEGTLCGSCHQSTAKFQHEEKSLVCGEGLAPLSSTTPLAMVTPSLPLPQPSAPQPPPPAIRAEPSTHPTAVPTAARHQLSTPIPPAPHLGFAPAVDEGTDGVVGASAAHVEVCPVPGLDQADEVAALPLGSRGERVNPSTGAVDCGGAMLVWAWDGMGHWMACGMGQHGSGVGMGHELASWRAQPWLVRGSSMGSLASYLPRKLSRTCLAGTEWVTEHCNTLECHPISTWLYMLGDGFCRVGHRDMNPPPVPATSPTPLPEGGFMVTTHVAVLA